LLGNLALMIVLLSSAIMALTFVSSQQTVRMLSRQILRQTINQSELQLQHFFAPVRQGLYLLRAWDEAGLLDTDQPMAMNRLLIPLMRPYAQISAVIVADERGREHILFHFGTTWRSRQTRRDTWGARTAWLAWTDEQPDPVASWKELDYDPRRRPWYQGARSVSQTLPADPSEVLPTSHVYWTKAYTFFTAKAPGMTAAMAFQAGNSEEHVVGVDVLLRDVSAFTMNLRAGENGEILVLTDDRRVIGLPYSMRHLRGEAQQAALLKQPHELGMPVVAAAVRALTARPPEARGPLRFVSHGRPWWGDMRPFPLTADRALTIVVIVPESDLLGNLRSLRLWIVCIMLGGLVIAIARMPALTRRYSRPIEALVHESDRISNGDLESGVVVASTITEVRRLAEAHERMRLALRTLLQLESDLQLARQIQQDTLPEQLPVLRGFEIDAWNEAAEATGGDTYDVIGYQYPPNEKAPCLTSTQAQQALLLVADASGHGIGAALCVTQLRAMLRMAIRAGEDLATILRHLNAQLCADLSDGRFITAWLGDLNASASTLTSFSCGQGPLLYYHAAQRTCEMLATDTFALGIFDDLDVQLAKPILMQPGDIFVVCSDGLFEATDAKDRPFGIERIMDVITQHHQASASQILTALRTALAAFTQAVPAADDRTVLIIKRVARVLL
jgi:serine phosphatase RsbU (regulator of sigma subunit)